MKRATNPTPKNGRPVTRRPRPGEWAVLSFKLDGALVQRLDEVAARWMAERPGSATTRSEVVRVALSAWLADHAPEK